LRRIADILGVIGDVWALLEIIRLLQSPFQGLTPFTVPATTFVIDIDGDTILNSGMLRSSYSTGGLGGKEDHIMSRRNCW
jgi:hypothetical protein